MASRIFIDTNIFLDLLLNRGRFGLAARDFLMKSVGQKAQLFTSISCIQTIIYVLEKERVQSQEIRESIKKLNSLILLANTSRNDINKAIRSKIEDLEDAILYYTAVSNDCDAFVTQNIKDYPVKDKKIMILRPEEFS